MMGAMNAKLLPKKMGTLPFVTRWKRRVPTPAEKSAVEGSRPTSNGTSTVAPKATKRYWTPTITWRDAERWTSELVMLRRWVGNRVLKEVCLRTRLQNYIYFFNSTLISKEKVVSKTMWCGRLMGRLFFWTDLRKWRRLIVDVFALQAMSKRTASLVDFWWDNIMKCFPKTKLI